MSDNTFKVPRSQWKKWNENERQLFENMFEWMRDNQHLCSHPLAATQKDECWKTTAWNAAWMAADFMREIRKDKLKKLNEVIGDSNA